MNRENEVCPIIGMSPGNSYFKDEEIAYLLKKTVEQYGRAVVMIADVPAVSTYIAFGYPENRARRDKAIPQGNLLKNRTERAMVQLGYSVDQVKIIDWEHEVEPNEQYQKSYSAIRHLYQNNEQFQQDADNTTRSVLEGSGRQINDIEGATKIAVHYLLSEFAFLDWASEFLGVKKVFYVYHKNWPVYENYIAGIYDGVARPHADFLLMENPWETYRTVWGSEDYAENPGLSVLERVQKTGMLRVAFTNYPPALLYDRVTDSFSGIFYEIITAIAKEQQWEIKWSEETGYGVIADGLNNDRFDIFGSTVWPTVERKEKLSLSASLYQSDVYIFSRPDFNYNEMKNSSELRVVVKENDISHDIAIAEFPHARLVFVPQLSDPQEVLQFVVDNKGDITFGEEYFASEYSKANNVLITKAYSFPIRTYDNVFVCKKGDMSLLDIFNERIQSMLDSGESKKVIEKYTGNNQTFITNANYLHL